MLCSRFANLVISKHELIHGSVSETTHANKRSNTATKHRARGSSKLPVPTTHNLKMFTFSVQPHSSEAGPNKMLPKLQVRRPAKLHNSKTIQEKNKVKKWV